ncbi:hypothetical protein AB5J52_13995 [Streptomyces sp. R39]|uniref:Transcriptional regulator n=1 Tax=Streptomyces sp. R39 TaxID=3238631 RepID=A0AB39QLF5_9ACTN
MPREKKLHTMHCPACRTPRRVRLVGTATVAKQPVSLAQCQAADCELIWAVRPPSATMTSHQPHQLAGGTE